MEKGGSYLVLNNVYNLFLYIADMIGVSKNRQKEQCLTYEALLFFYAKRFIFHYDNRENRLFIVTSVHSQSKTLHAQSIYFAKTSL